MQNKLDPSTRGFDRAEALKSANSALIAARAGQDLLFSDTTFGGNQFASLTDTLLIQPLKSLIADPAFSNNEFPVDSARTTAWNLASVAKDLATQLSPGIT